MSQIDQLDTFSSYMKELEQKEEEEKAKEREKRRRKERKARDSFRELLKELEEEGKITYQTRYRSEAHFFLKCYKAESAMGKDSLQLLYS